MDKSNLQTSKIEVNILNVIRGQKHVIRVIGINIFDIGRQEFGRERHLVFLGGSLDLHIRDHKALRLWFLDSIRLNILSWDLRLSNVNLASDGRLSVLVVLHSFEVLRL